MTVSAIHILASGFLELDRKILLKNAEEQASIIAPVFSVLLMHAEGPILIDAGLNPEGLENPESAWGARAKIIKPHMTVDDDIRNRLSALNLTVDDIKLVVITHLHWDHCGALRHFTDCPIYVQKEEYDHAVRRDSQIGEQYMLNHYDHPLRYRLLEGDEEICEGVQACSTPGHSPGHQSIVVHMKNGKKYIIAGDAVSLEANMKSKIPGANAYDEEQAIESINRIEQIANRLNAAVVPSHDVAAFRRFKQMEGVFVP